MATDRGAAFTPPDQALGKSKNYQTKPPISFKPRELSIYEGARLEPKTPRLRAFQLEKRANKIVRLLQSAIRNLKLCWGCADFLPLLPILIKSYQVLSSAGARMAAAI